jgi:AraC-like DNA-binding protein
MGWDASLAAKLPLSARSGAAPIRFTTAELPPMDRFDAWVAAFGSLNAIDVPVEARPAAQVCSENWHFGGMALSRNRVSDSRFLRDERRARRDGMDHWILRVLSAGQCLLQHPGFTARLGPGEPLLFSMHEGWATQWWDAEWVSLTIPRDLCPHLAAQLATLPSGPVRSPCAGLLGDLLLALPSRVAATPASALDLLGEATRATVAACLFIGAAPPAAVASVADLEKERVRKAIHRHLGSTRLTPARLAATVGMSRSALYRMFAGEGGVASYVRHVRLSLAHAALRDPQQAGRGIAEIAEAHGFPDPSAFSRAFRQAFGATPGDVRAAALPGPPPRLGRPSALADRPTEDLVARIYGLP